MKVLAAIASRVSTVDRTAFQLQFPEGLLRWLSDERCPCRLILRLHGVVIGRGMALRIFLNHPDPKPNESHEHPCHARTISAVCCAMRQVAVAFEVDVTECFLAGVRGGYSFGEVIRLDLLDALFHPDTAEVANQTETVELSAELQDP